MQADLAARGRNCRVTLVTAFRVTFWTGNQHGSLAARGHCSHNAGMRVLGIISMCAVLVFGLYYAYLQKSSMGGSVARPRQTISLAGVQTDLMQIGQGERTFVAQNGRCASLDELISSNSLTMTTFERDGYTYSVDCSGADFTVIARHPEPPNGGPRYLTLALDSTLQMQQHY